MSVRSMRWWTGSLVLVAALAAGCGGTGGTSSTTTEPSCTGDKCRAGPPDNPTGAVVRVDEAAITAAIAGDGVHVWVPATATGDARIAVRLEKVDGSQAQPEVLADVPSSGDPVEVVLDRPEGIASQADLVAWNIRVTSPEDDAVLVRRSLLQSVPPFDLVVEGPSVMRTGQPAVFRVYAADPISGQPIEGVSAQVEVRRDGEVVETHDVTTGPDGDAVLTLAPDQPGTLSVGAHAEHDGVVADSEVTVEAQDSPRKVMLTTDKPVYQPGQVMHLRALALDRTTLAPVAGEDVLFEIKDGKGNKVYKHAVTADEYGIAATTFQLGNIVNTGDYEIRASLGDVQTVKTVRVDVYALPRFKVNIALDKPWYAPGETVAGAVDARYFFGKPVAGATVEITAAALDIGETVFGTYTGKTDADGHLEFHFTLPTNLVGLPLDQGKALVSLKVHVVDTAGQQVDKTAAITVAPAALLVAAVPASGEIVPGVDNTIHIFVSTPAGAAVEGAQIVLSGPGASTQPATTDATGHATLTVHPPDTTAASAGSGGMGAPVEAPFYSLHIVGPDGAELDASFNWQTQGGADHVLVRTDKSIYSVGDDIHVDVLTTGPSKWVYLNWLVDGQIVEMRTLEAQDGRATTVVTADTTMAGANRIEAYIVDRNANIVRAARAVFVRRTGELKVTMSTDKPIYEPAEDAKLTFSVEDESGQPTVAALGVQIVDEAVFALVEATPGLLKTYFELEGMFSQPKVEIHGISFNLPDLVFGGAGEGEPEQAKAVQDRAEAALAVAGTSLTTGVRVSSWAHLPAQTSQVLQPYIQAERQRLLELYKQVADGFDDYLAASGCAIDQYYCDPLGSDVAELLGRYLDQALVPVDFWGNAYARTPQWGSLELRSSGPDEVDGNADDVIITVGYADLGFDNMMGPVAEGGDFDRGGAGGGMAADAGASAPPEAPNGQKDDEGPRVRKDFPETLYVNPEVITGPDGKATVTVPLADSITKWRVTTVANSANGKLGGGIGGVTVFQDFFVDVSFPAKLTRGDEVRFPIALYNYLDEPQQVSVEVQPAPWFTALGPTSYTVDLAPGEVKGIRMPIRAEKVGLHELVVTAIGSSKSDAVARVARVVPDGKPVVSAQSGSLQPGSVELNVAFPQEAVEDSEELLLNLYPAFMTQLVEGLDSMLREPFG